MSGAAVIEESWIETGQRNDRRGRDKAVEQHGDRLNRAARSAPAMAASSRPPNAAAQSSGSRRIAR